MGHQWSYYIDYLQITLNVKTFDVVVEKNLNSWQQIPDPQWENLVASLYFGKMSLQINTTVCCVIIFICDQAILSWVVTSRMTILKWFDESENETAVMRISSSKSEAIVLRWKRKG